MGTPTPTPKEVLDRLFDAIERGETPTLRVTQSDDEFAAPVGFMARALACDPLPEAPNILRITADFAAFDEHNRTVSKPDYYDAEGVPRLHWHQTPNYPKTGEVEFCVRDDGETLPFELVDAKD